MAKLTNLVFFLFGKPCFFLPILDRENFRTPKYTQEEFNHTDPNIMQHFARNTSTLPYTPLINIDDTLVLSYDGVHLEEASYIALGIMASQHIRREMAGLSPRIRRPLDIARRFINNARRNLEAPPIEAPAPYVEVPHNAPHHIEAPPRSAPAQHNEVQQAPAPSPPQSTPALTHTQMANIIRYTITLTSAINAQKHEDGLTIFCGSCRNTTHMAYRKVYLLAALSCAGTMPPDALIIRP